MKTIITSLFAIAAVADRVQDCQHASILGATYGGSDITSKVAHHYNLGNNVVPATNDWVGHDPLTGHTKTMTIVYERCGNFATVTAQEGGQIELPQ